MMTMHGKEETQYQGEYLAKKDHETITKENNIMGKSKLLNGSLITKIDIPDALRIFRQGLIHPQGLSPSNTIRDLVMNGCSSLRHFIP